MGFFVGRPRKTVAGDLETDGAVKPVEISEVFGPLLDSAFAREAEPDDQVRTSLVRDYLGKGTLNLVNQRARTRGSEGDASRRTEKESTTPEGGPIYWWRVLAAMTFLGAVLFTAYSLEGNSTHTQTRDVLFNIVQVGFPGLLALLGIETTKNG